MQYTISQLKEIFSPTMVWGSVKSVINELSIDSRTLMHGDGILFFAITGKNNNGHHYLKEAYNKGVRVFVVECLPDDDLLDDDCCYFVVGSSEKALQQLAANYRCSFAIPIIGITGSNGKTVVKEWLASVLASRGFYVTRSPKSYNSQVGVPLSVSLLNGASDIGIFEAGISRTGEMKNLSKVIDPQIGIFTTLTDAHQENFVDREQKLTEKFRLFNNCEQIIYNKDEIEITQFINEKDHYCKKAVGWSFNTSSDITFAIENSKSGVVISGTSCGNLFKINFPFKDSASLQNVGHVLATLTVLQLDVNDFAKAFDKLEAVAMRMEIKQGANNCLLINDSYNSDVGSLKISLGVLNAQSYDTAIRKTLILSDIEQSGLGGKELYREVNKLLTESGIDYLLGVGEGLSKFDELFSIDRKFFLNTDSLLLYLKKQRLSNQNILIKGARKYQFDQVASMLQQKQHQTALEVDLNAMISNLNQFRQCLNPSTEIMVMVKAFSYGSGSTEIASLLQYHRVGALAVAIADEGVELRKSGITIPIVVMNPEAHSFDLMIQYQLDANIYSLALLRDYDRAVKRNAAKDIPIHLKLDTGMHRLGFDQLDDLIEAAMVITGSRRLRLRSVFSHLASSDEPMQDMFTQEQINCFEEMSMKLASKISYPIKRHILNSAGIERFSNYQYDMVRLGIGLYGVSSGGRLALQNVSSLVTTVSQIRTVHEGQTIGYGRHGRADRDLQIAVLPIGYADGYNRRLGNGLGEVMVNGHRVHTIGNICMDMCMIDITGVDVRVGDRVELFGEHIPLQELAQKLGTIPYEVLTSISQRVKRVYIQE